MAGLEQEGGTLGDCHRAQGSGGFLAKGLSGKEEGA